MNTTTGPDWSSLMQEGEKYLDELEAVRSRQVNENGLTTTRTAHHSTNSMQMGDDTAVSPQVQPLAEAQDSRMIDPELLATHPPAQELPQQTQTLSNQKFPTRTVGSSKQHPAGRVFGHRFDQRSVHLQYSIDAGPMPTHESEAHQVLRQIAPKLQALMELFAVAYETNDMEKVEELRRRLSWAIDARGN